MDAIDNMDLNEYNGRVLKVNLAKTTKLIDTGKVLLGARDPSCKFEGWVP